MKLPLGAQWGGRPYNKCQPPAPLPPNFLEDDLSGAIYAGQIEKLSRSDRKKDKILNYLSLSPVGLKENNPKAPGYGRTRTPSLAVPN